MSCNICNENDESLFYPYNKYRCKECIKKTSKKHREENKEMKKKSASIYYQKNKEHLKKEANKNRNYSKEYSKNNKEKISAYLKIYWKKQIEEVSDIYLKCSGFNIDNKEIATVKRELIKIKREIKKQTL